MLFVSVMLTSMSTYPLFWLFWNLSFLKQVILFIVCYCYLTPMHVWHENHDLGKHEENDLIEEAFNIFLFSVDVVDDDDTFISISIDFLKLLSKLVSIMHCMRITHFFWMWTSIMNVNKYQSYTELFQMKVCKSKHHVIVLILKMPKLTSRMTRSCVLDLVLIRVCFL